MAYDLPCIQTCALAKWLARRKQKLLRKTKARLLGQTTSVFPANQRSAHCRSEASENCERLREGGAGAPAGPKHSGGTGHAVDRPACRIPCRFEGKRTNNRDNPEVWRHTPAAVRAAGLAYPPPCFLTLVYTLACAVRIERQVGQRRPFKIGRAHV